VLSNVGLENIRKRKSFSKNFAILKDEGLLQYRTRPGWHFVTLLLMCACVGSEDLINSPTKNYLLYKIDSVLTGYNCLLFTILRPFRTKESIRRKVDHRGQIVLWYWQHATNLVRATMFIVCMSLARVLVWVRGKAEQKCSRTFCVFGQTRSKCSSSSTFPKS
jgi:hypothetical protein